MSQTFEIQSPVKSFYGCTLRKRFAFSNATDPVQVLGLTPANEDNGNPKRPCTTHHVFRGDNNNFLFDFPAPTGNDFMLKVEASGLPPGGVDIDLGVGGNGTVFNFGSFLGNPNRSGVSINWTYFLDTYGTCECTFFIDNTSIVSQKFLVHLDTDTFYKDNSVLIKITSYGVYRNYRYFDGGVEPKIFDLPEPWVDYLRVSGGLTPETAETEKKFVTYASYAKDLSRSNDNDRTRFDFKGKVAAYIVRRFEYYGLSSELYLTDDNSTVYDIYENKRYIYAGNKDFTPLPQIKYLYNPNFTLSEAYEMGMDNRVKIF